MKLEAFPYVDIEKLADDLYVAEEMGSNVFFIRGEEKILVLDTAYGMTDWKALAKTLFPGGQELICCNSHGHFDHNSGNVQFDSVFVGRFDEPSSHRKLDERAKQGGIAFIGSRLDGVDFDPEAWHPGPAPHIEPLKDGDEIDLGGVCLKVIETPGHSLGSIALYEPRKRWLFTGDTALTWEVWGQLANSAALRVYAESLRKLADLEQDVDYVFPAHTVADHPASCGRYWLPPRVLSIYADGTEKIVRGELQGHPYEELNPRFQGMRYELFEIGGMAYDPDRI